MRTTTWSALADGLREYGVRLAVMFAYFAGMLVLALPIALWAPMIVRTVGGVVLWLAMLVAVGGRSPGRFDPFGGFAGVIPLMMTMLGLQDYVALRSAEIVEGIGVAELPRHPEAGGFVLTDAVIQARFRTTVAIPHRDVKGHVSTWHVTVVPLTAVDWTPDRPIPAWVACPLFRCVEGDGRSFLAIHEVQEDGYGQARDEARAKHGLRDAPGAPIVESVASIPEAIADRGDVLIDVWIWVYGGWAIGLGGYMLLRGSRHGAGGLKPRAAAR